MALLSDLVKAIAKVQGLEEAQVAWVSRHLREAGLITQAGRGRGAARMSIQDAANLLIGVNAPTVPIKAPGMVHMFRDLELARDFAAPDEQEDWDAVRDDDSWFSLAFRRGARFGNTLERTIDACRTMVDGITVPPAEEVRITLFGPNAKARIYMGELSPERASDIQTDSEFDYSHLGILKDAIWPDQLVSKTFTHKTLIEVAYVLNN